MVPLGRFALPFVAAYIDGVAPRLNPKLPRGAVREISMKSKTFSGDGPAAVIKAVNDWLGGKSGVTVRHTETREANPEEGTARLTFEVWYDQEER